MVTNNNINIFLSGEIHTEWRIDIIKESKNHDLPINFFSPETNHSNSDDCGVSILGPEENKFWHDYKGASINAIKNNIQIKKSDIIIIKFGDKYKQWNAAFDAGYAIGNNKIIITLHNKELDHALKEIDASAKAVCRSNHEVIKTLKYITTGKL
ncbi:MAG: hypothetical protein CMJ06_05900 [Pelagibacterales bacterium]|nr:hypothetical protein [Pelagibacterales bacterium]OUU61310.1 MAG: hypothetical protein CBC22_08045 [Alphaproteobacteria bacterium TMED62]|tara:strand:- start:3228 stop:3689 length:462 start_codon:yes stop_codon:yes gene_type:complete